MLTGIDAPNTPAAGVAAGILDGLEADVEDIFPDQRRSDERELADDPKGFQRGFPRTDV